jgi:hypothetical protein
MNNTTSALLGFVIGAGISSVLTWKLLKTKYEQMADEEIDSIKKYYSEKDKKVKKKEEMQEEAVNIINENGYANESTSLKEENMVQYSASSKKVKKKEEKVIKTHFEIIPQDEYGLEEDYDCIVLYHMSDGVLLDENFEDVSNVADKIGLDYMTHFNEFDDDSIFIKNDKYKAYYEISRDDRASYEVNDDD